MVTPCLESKRLDMPKSVSFRWPSMPTWLGLGLRVRVGLRVRARVAARLRLRVRGWA